MARAGGPRAGRCSQRPGHHWRQILPSRAAQIDLSASVPNVARISRCGPPWRGWAWVTLARGRPIWTVLHASTWVCSEPPCAFMCRDRKKNSKELLIFGVPISSQLPRSQPRFPCHAFLHRRVLVVLDSPHVLQPQPAAAAHIVAVVLSDRSRIVRAVPEDLMMTTRQTREPSMSDHDRQVLRYRGWRAALDAFH